MREIKFRGRDAYGKYRYGDLWQRKDGTLIYDEVWHRVNPVTVAQLIGHDSQGREVYEGDTLAGDNGNSYIAMFDCVLELQNDRVDQILISSAIRRIPIKFAKRCTKLTLVEAAS